MSSSHDNIDLHQPDGLVHVHVHPASTYVKIFVALVLFTLITVGLSRIHLGQWNFFIAVAVATIKASLVGLFFMHLKDDNRFNVLIFVGSLLFIGVFFIYTMNDTQKRGQWDESYGTRVSPATGEVAPGRGQYEKIELKGGHGEAHGGTPSGHVDPAHQEQLKEQGGAGPERGGPAAPSADEAGH